MARSLIRNLTQLRSDFKESCRVATTAALPSYVASGAGATKTLTASSTGALVIDGMTLAVNDRVLVKNEGGGIHVDNGIYYVFATGSVITPWELKRTIDAFDGANFSGGVFTVVEEGVLNAETAWILRTNGVIVVDTTALEFVGMSGQTLEFDQGLLKTVSTVKIELDATADLEGVGAGGGSSGLEFDVNTAVGKLRLAVDPTGGVQRNASGAAAKRDGNSITSSMLGLRVNFDDIVLETDGKIVIDTGGNVVTLT